MDIQSSKLELVKLIIQTENKVIIENLIQALKSEHHDFWNDLSNSEKDEIRTGIKQLNENNRINLDDFLNKVT